MIKTDAVIIGAGPVGLFSIHQLGIKGLKSEVIDNLDRAGGQCIALYPDKPIYDIPAIHWKRVDRKFTQTNKTI